MEAFSNTIDILKNFFEYPNKGFLIREVARLTKINHTTVRQHLNQLVKEEILLIETNGLYPCFKLNPNKKSLNLKIYFNLEKIRKSEIIDNLEKIYDYPTIILFGSYSKAIDDENSDIDLCILTEIKREITLDKYSKSLKRKVSIHLFNHKSWQEAKTKNPNLVNSICNGIILSGQFEVV